MTEKAHQTELGEPSPKLFLHSASSRVWVIWRPRPRMPRCTRLLRCGWLSTRLTRVCIKAPRRTLCGPGPCPLVIPSPLPGCSSTLVSIDTRTVRRTHTYPSCRDSCHIIRTKRSIMALKSLVLLATAFAGGLVSATPTAYKPVAPSDLPIRIVSGASDQPDELELTAARAVIFDIEEKIGQKAYANIVWEDAAKADAYWHSLQVELNKTAADKQPEPLLSLALVQAFAPASILNATTIFLFTENAGAGFPNGLMHTNSQHRASYGQAGLAGADIDITGFENSAGIQFETWGTNVQNMTTYFGVYPLNITTQKPSFMPALADYDLQYASEQRLRDGSLFGWTLKASKNLPKGAGVEVWMGTWILGNAAQWVSDALTAHLTHEFTQTMRLAYAYGLGEDYLLV
ncbi:hypothetical protein F5Y16DRAFT_376935 [Xylariaceae sp. FL0255]|nr:hypothetical protein F5Y16DRAFT_376935 [Xylariaceae sp. FL0255]